MMGKYKKLGKNILLFIAGSFGSKVITFFLMPLYTTRLTTQQYGIVDLVFTLASLIMPAFTILIYYGLMRYSLEPEADHAQLFSGAIVVELIGLVGMLLLSPILLRFQSLAQFYWHIVFYFAMNAISTFMLFFARGLDRVLDYSLTTVISTGLAVLFNVVFLVVLNSGVNGYLMAYSLAMFLSTLFLAVRLRIWTYLLPLKRISKDTIGKLVKYSAPLVPNSISWWISNQSDKFIIIMYHGIALSGVYAIGYKIPSILNVISTIFISAWQISSVERFGSDESKNFFSDIFDKYVTIQVLATSVVIIASKMIAKLLFKNSFYSAWIYIPILSLAVMFHAIGTFFSSVYTSAKRTTAIAVATIIGAATNIILNIILIKLFSAYGAAIATLISYIVVVIIQTVHTRSFFSFRINYKKDILCYLLLAVEVSVLTMQIPFANVICVGLLLLIGIIRRDSIQKTLYQVKRIVRSKFHSKPQAL